MCKQDAHFFGFVDSKTTGSIFVPPSRQEIERREQKNVSRMFLGASIYILYIIKLSTAVRFWSSAILSGKNELVEERKA